MSPCSDLFLSLECPFSVPRKKAQYAARTEGFFGRFLEEIEVVSPGAPLKKQFGVVP
jgi:hypothetical protein